MKQLNCTQQVTFHLDYKHFPVVTKVIKGSTVGKKKKSGEYVENNIQRLLTIYLKELPVLSMVTATTSPIPQSFCSFGHFALL